MRFSKLPVVLLRPGILLLPVILLLILAAVSWTGCKPESKPHGTLVEGRVSQVSPMPDPETNPYKDCLFTAVLEVDSAEATNVSARLLLVLPGFLDRKPTPNASLQSHQLVRGRLRPFSDLGEPWASMQQADTVEELALPMMFAERLEIIDAFTSLANQPAPPETPIFSSSPRGTASNVQTSRIAAETQRIEELRDAHGGWDAWWSELEPIRQHVVSSPLPRFEAPFAIWRVGPLTRRFEREHPHTQSMLASLSELRNAFASRGVDLVLAPVPSRDLIGIDQLHGAQRPPDGIWNPERLRRNLALLRRGIEVLDTSEALRAAATTNREPLFFFESHDAHPVDGTLKQHGRAIAERVRATPNLPPFTPGNVSLQWIPIAPPHVHEAAGFVGRYAYPIASDADGRGHPSDVHSPVLLFGDSFLRNPDGGGISDVVCAELDHVAHTVVRSSGALEMPRHLARADLDWDRLKVAVFVFDETLLDPHPEHWAVVPFDALRLEREAFGRLHRETSLLFDFNSQEDFALLQPREKPVGFVASPKRAYIPWAGSPLHLDCPESSFESGKPVLVFLHLRTRHPQSMDVLFDGQVVRSLRLNHMVNTLRLVLRPERDARRLTLRIPQAGGNLFVEAFKVYR